MVLPVKLKEKTNTMDTHHEVEEVSPLKELKVADTLFIPIFFESISISSFGLFKASSFSLSGVTCIQNFSLQFLGIIAGPIYDRGHLRLLLLHRQRLESYQFHGSLLKLKILPSVALIRLVVLISAQTNPASRLWVVQVVSFIVLATFAIPLVVMCVRVRAAKPRAVVDWSVFLDTHFMVFVLAEFFSFIAILIASSYISFYPLNRSFTDQGLAIIAAAVAIGFLSVTEDKSLIGTGVKMGFAISGLGLLVGGPATGSILRATSGPLSWTCVWVYGGLAACVIGLVDGCVHIMKS
ncbi:monocarboxylate permease-like protein, mch4 [Xylaria sp. FL0064]|nr:monocarboxylate permease-like protein, mch4 [Xylaria sp. FL0064]